MIEHASTAPGPGRPARTSTTPPRRRHRLAPARRHLGGRTRRCTPAHRHWTRRTNRDRHRQRHRRPTHRLTRRTEPQPPSDPHHPGVRRSTP
ncbi:hypothetical protein NKH18_02705 [Streptomyces sp. M10(2022)]